MAKFVDDETASGTWVEYYKWVGIVYPQDIHETVTLITPLASYDQSDNCNDGWQAITESERSKYFPNNGKVARFTRDFPEQKVHRLYWFQPERNQQNFSSENITTADSRYSRYLTHSDSNLTSEPLAQVFDWSSRASHLLTIPDLLNQGIPAQDCLSHTIFVLYQNQIYGPIHLEPDLHNVQDLKPREYNQRLNSFGQPLLLNGYNLAKQKIIKLAGLPFIDQKILGSPISQVDWSLPQMTIRRLLNASKNASVGLQEKLRLTEKEIKELASLSASSGPESLHLEECVIQRGQYIISKQMKQLDGLQTLIEELPSEHPLLEKARVLEVQHRKEKIAQKYEAEKSHLQSLRAEVRSAQENLTRLNSEIEAAKQKQEQMRTDLAALEVSLPKRLTEVREEMLSLLKELQLTSALPLALSQTNAEEMAPETQKSGAISTIHQQNHFLTEKVTILVNLPDLDSHCEDIAAQNGVSAERVKSCVLDLRKGLIPVANSPTDFTILQAVAQGITGQRIWRVPVPLTATSPLALFGDILADQQSFLPAAGELADIIIEAETHPEHLGLIVLEGIDRVPFLPVIEPLLRQYRVVRQHIQQTGKTTACQETLSLFHPQALHSQDPYQKISRLAWPANLLLGVTVDEEISNFPLPETYASWFTRIQHMETDNHANSHWPGKRKTWQISPISWYAWEKECADRASQSERSSTARKS